MLELLQKYAGQWLQLELGRDQMERYQLYYQELVDWNQRMNLTAITEYEAVQVRHFLDSLTLAAPWLRGDAAGQSFELSQAKLIDIGAGAGFPGLPLKILYPAIKLTLVESITKKTTFLRHVCAELGFQDVEIINARAEDLGQSPDYREQYDLATGRAVAAWVVLAEYCLPLCRLGGLFIAPKKGDLQLELAHSRPVAELLGAKLRATPAFQMPGENPDPAQQRRLVVAEKYRSTPKAYPRAAGQPAKQPLAT